MSNIKLFENKKIRTEWDAEQEDWYFSTDPISHTPSLLRSATPFSKMGIFHHLFVRFALHF